MNQAAAHSEFHPDTVRRMGVSVSFASAVGQRGEDAHKLPVQTRAPRKTGSKLSQAEKEMSGCHEKADNSKPAEEAPRKANQGDRSAQILEKLSEKQRKIFEEMPLDKAVTIDYLSKTGFALGEVISALTVLEIKGLVSSLPGALYIRK